ncbi:MAG: hydroxysqualene dehydroxylase HpnE [Rhodospirillales bacterium]
MSACIHIVGAGMAGLAAGARLAASGQRIVLHEMAGHAGGRCRSLFDEVLGCDIDNGNHLILSGNHSIAAYLADCGRDTSAFRTAPTACFDFHDLATGGNWRIDMGLGRLPGWVFDPARRADGTGAMDYLRGLKLAFAGERTVADLLGRPETAFRNFWEPLSVAILNTEPEIAAASLLWPDLRETVARGGDACRPMIAREGLGPALVEPGLSALLEGGGDIRFGTRLKAVRRSADGKRAEALVFDDGEVLLGADDGVILAVPSWHIARLLPDARTPDSHRGITNVHYRLPEPLAKPGEPFLRGVVGGVAQWVFVRGDHVSVTVSASETYESGDRGDLPERVYREVASALGLTGMPPVASRVIREKRATFTQSPAQLKRRNGPETAMSNLILAGDWTATGLPATIEGAVRSGHIAAAKLSSSRGKS